MTFSELRRTATMAGAAPALLAGLVMLSCGSELVAPEEEEVQVASVTVSPTSPTVGVTQTLQLFAAALDAAGTAVSATVTWTSLGPSIATVDASGLVSGVSEGTAGVVAQAGSVADTVQVTVTSGGPNQVTYFEEGFEDLDFAARGWYDNTSMTVSTAEKRSGNSSLEVHFEQGAIAPTFGTAARRLFEETQSVYVSFWVKYSENWVGSGRNYHPHDIQLITNKDDPYVGPTDTRLTTYIETNHDGTGVLPVLIVRDRLNIDGDNANVDLTGVTENRAVAGCNGSSDPYPTSCSPYGEGDYTNGKLLETDGPYIGTGQWHFIEAYFQLNTIQDGIGRSDGIARYWVDGVAAFDVDDILFRTGVHPDMAFNQFVFGFWMDGSPVAQTMWVDDLEVADRR